MNSSPENIKASYPSPNTAYTTPGAGLAPNCQVNKAVLLQTPATLPLVHFILHPARFTHQFQ